MDGSNFELFLVDVFLTFYFIYAYDFFPDRNLRGKQNDLEDFLNAEECVGFFFLNPLVQAG